MDGSSVRGWSRRFGHVSVRSLGPDPSRSLDSFLYTWHPGPAIDTRGGDELDLELRCLVSPGGARGFNPAKCVEGFLLRASVGGLAILAERQGMEPKLRGYHHALRLIFQHAPRAREHLGRSFRKPADLLVVGDDGAALGGRDILPDGLGLDARGKGSRWSVGELLERGRAAARVAGEADPDGEQAIAAGLYEAARLDPMAAEHVSAAQARALVDLALFDPPPPTTPGPDEERAVKRILDRLGDHLDDDAESFRGRFFDRRDDLIRQVAKQVGDGGPIDREIVRRAFLMLVRDAYESVGTCFTAQMGAFLDALPDPLDAEERSRFAALYLGRPYLGGMPLLMLRERFPFLRPAVLGVLQDPDDPSRVGALQRMLAYYGEMSQARRAADRSYKRRAGHRDRSGRVATTRQLEGDSDRVEVDVAEAAALGEVAERVCRLGGISCPCGPDATWEARLPGDATADPAEVELNCTRCGHVAHSHVSAETLREIGSGLSGSES